MNDWLAGVRIIRADPKLDGVFKRTVPVRVHKRGTGQSAAYHRRVQKKWAKRYGMREERLAFMFDAALFSLDADSRSRTKRAVIVTDAAL